MSALDAQPRFRRRRQDIFQDAQAVPVAATRKRRDRLAKGVAEDGGEETVHSESMWLDGPLALTLLPPLASFLTGGDFIRDGLVLALLFYYLRALVKTPWELYLKARARRTAPTEESESEEDEPESESLAAVRQLARSELRFAELVYLSLCLLTPFLGTLLLRYVSSLLSTDGTINWFSNGLFVLATGIRPWRHLVSLLITRTDSLHDIVHTPPKRSKSKAQAQVQVQIDERTKEVLAEATARIDGLEAVIDELRANAQKPATASSDVLTLKTGLEGNISKAMTAAMNGVAEVQSRVARSEDKLLEAVNVITDRLDVLSDVIEDLRASKSSTITKAEVRSLIARLGENVEQLETQLQNSSRANEAVRSDSEARLDELQQALQTIVNEVESLQRGVAAAATAAANAHTAATARPTEWILPKISPTSATFTDRSASLKRKIRTRSMSQQPSSQDVVPVHRMKIENGLYEQWNAWTLRSSFQFVIDMVLLPVRISQKLLRTIFVTLGVLSRPTAPVRLSVTAPTSPTKGTKVME